MALIGENDSQREGSNMDHHHAQGNDPSRHRTILYFNVSYTISIVISFVGSHCFQSQVVFDVGEVLSQHQHSPQNRLLGEGSILSVYIRICTQ